MESKELYLEALDRVRRLLDRARVTSLREPAAMTLATVDKRGRPSARVVLLRGVDERGFVFYTQSISAKGKDLEANPRAALCFYWDPLGEQLRVEGDVQRLPDTETDRYWFGRPRESRIGAWASLQSETLDRRQTLEERFAEYESRFESEEVPRPERWGGYRVIPDRIELWRSRPARLHERSVYELVGSDWTFRMLYP